jgi:hypothetical protein
MTKREWHEEIDTLSPAIVKLATPSASGTGFLLSVSATRPLVAIATAAHVVDHAHYWEQPIRVDHFASGKSLLLRHADRAILLNAARDSAAIIFEKKDLPLPTSPVTLIERTFHMKPGVEVGWLGFPALPRASLSFFSGRISAWIEEESAYLIDGVAINGVSGGAAFAPGLDGPEVIGVVSAYMPNRNSGETLPGLAVIRDVEEFHGVTDRMRNLDEAQAQQTPPGDAPPTPPGEHPARSQ